MKIKYENVYWRSDKNKYVGKFLVEGKRYSAGYSKDPYELYLRTKKKKEEVLLQHKAMLLNISEQGEVWKDIPLLEDKFMISNYGRIKSLSNIKPGILEYSTPTLRLKSNNGKVVNVDIAKTVVKLFLKSNISNELIFHKDGDKLNNHIENLILKTKDEVREERYLSMVEEAKTFPGVYVDKKNLTFRLFFEYGCKEYRRSSNNIKELISKTKSAKEKIFKENNLLLEELLPQEEFKPIKNTTNLFVSNKGRVYKLDKFGLKIIRNGFISKGYITHSINKKHVKLHQLVAEAFLGHTINGHTVVVDHIDHNTLNNNVENLQLISNIKNSSKKKTKKHNLPIGVTLSYSGKYYATATKKSINLGMFDTPEEAHEAYKNFWLGRGVDI